MITYLGKRYSNIRTVIEAIKLNSRKYSLELVKNDGFEYVNLLDKFKEDEEIIFEALKSRITILADTPEAIRNKKDFMLKVIELPHFKFVPLELIGKDLLKDKEFFLKLLNINEFAYIKASEELKSDIDVIKLALTKDNTNLYSLPLWFKEEHNITTIYDVERYLNHERLQQELSTKPETKKKVFKV